MPKRVAFAAAAAEFLEWCEGEYRLHPNSHRRIRVSFTSLADFFKEAPVSSITAGDVELFKTWRRKKPRRQACTLKDHVGPRPIVAGDVSDVTVRHDLHALSGFFQYAQRRNWAKRNPVREVQIPSDWESVRIRVVSQEEEQSYFAAATKYTDLHDLAGLMLRQGLRPDEALHLEKRNYDPAAGTILIARGKSKAARRLLKLVADSEAIVRARLSSPGPWLFPSPLDWTRPLTKLNHKHDKVLAATGLSFVLYDFRHTFATRMAQAGMPLTTLAAILGHSSLRVVVRYVHPSQADMDQSMLRFGQPAPPAIVAPAVVDQRIVELARVVSARLVEELCGKPAGSETTPVRAREHSGLLDEIA